MIYENDYIDENEIKQEQLINKNKNSFCNRHFILYIILFIIGIPLIISSIYIAIFGFSCVFFYQNVIQQCSSPFLKISSNVSIIIVSVNYSAQSFLCFVTCLFLGAYGIQSASHHSRIDIKKSHRVDCCNKIDVRTLLTYFYYFFPTILLIIESGWKFLILNYNLLIFLQISISLFLTTFSSLTIFPMILNDPRHLYLNQQLSTDQLKDDRIDFTNLDRNLLTTNDSQNYYNDEFNIINNEFIESMEKDEFSFFCGICSYKYRPRFTWLPLFLLTFFIVNICWLFYDISFLILYMNNSSNMLDWQINFLLSAINIYYRWQLTKGYFKKLLYPDLIVPFSKHSISNYKVDQEHTNYITINGNKITERVINIEESNEDNTILKINDKLCFDKNIYINKGNMLYLNNEFINIIKIQKKLNEAIQEISKILEIKQSSNIKYNYSLKNNLQDSDD